MQTAKLYATCIQGAHMYASAPKRALATSSMHFRSALATRTAAKCTPDASIAVSRALLSDLWLGLKIEILKF